MYTCLHGIYFSTKFSFLLILSISFGVSCVFTYSLYLDSVQDGSTALMVAAQNGHLRIVELLIAAKALVNIQTNVSHIDGVCVLADCVVECVH